MNCCRSWTPGLEDFIHNDEADAHTDLPGRDFVDVYTKVKSNDADHYDARMSDREVQGCLDLF